MHDALGLMTDASAFAAVTIAPNWSRHFSGDWTFLVLSALLSAGYLVGFHSQNASLTELALTKIAAEGQKKSCYVPCFSFSVLNILRCSRFERGASSVSLSFFLLRDGLFFPSHHRVISSPSENTLYIELMPFTPIIHLLEWLDLPSKYPI